ncbi:serine hydrolase [Streptomyces sp. NPDC046909]|uniref:serine hydrolase n=1 Tax=Streptomyces sp. NPDC046909 TaxID=3155617 RepID=UPI0033CC161E
MTAHRIRAFCTALALSLLVPLLAATSPAAVPAAPAVTCSSRQADLAQRLRTHIATALSGRSGTIAVGLHDRTTKTTCTLRAGNSFDSASVVKVIVLATMLWDAEDAGRTLTKSEKSLATAMITRSSNSATDTLWGRLGSAKVRGFLDAARMTWTEPNPYGYWGLTQVNVRDELRLLDLLTGKNSVLGAASRAYILGLMAKVIPSQRWGVSAGAPKTATVHLKNGWLPRSSYAWRVHSVGAFRGGGHDYTLAVLSHGNSTMTYGVNTVQRVARAVHADLAPADRDRYAPPAEPDEVIPPVPGPGSVQGPVPGSARPGSGRGPSPRWGGR